MIIDLLNCCHEGQPSRTRTRLGSAVATLFFCSLFAMSANEVAAADVESLDLASISLQPAYISPSQIRASSCLRAVAFSPLDRNAPPPSRSVSYNEPQRAPDTIGIAVGDAGTILRSDDGGDSWWPVEYVHVSRESEYEQPRGSSGRLNDLFGSGSQRGSGRGRSSSDLVPIPFCEFSDVLWVSPRDVIVVGGGYEPVTGISRGVCVLSHDAGETWYLADAHELPRMRKVRLGARGALEAIGDPSEASGVNRFGSYDGGETWVEEMLPASGQQVAKVVSDHGTAMTIPTASGSIRIHDRCDTPTSSQIAVTSHGRIFRRQADETHWRSVRGQGRSTAVLFIAASPATVPWAIVGRETLQENRRTAILLDDDRAALSGDDDFSAVERKQLDRCRAAAAMMGVSDVGRCRPAISGSPTAVAATSEAEARRRGLLREHQPVVVVLDESLHPSVRQAWLHAIEQVRVRTFTSTGSAADLTAANDWSGPRRIVLTRRAGESSSSTAASPQWQRAWSHASVLRGNALLTGPGILASDLAMDALMLASPGTVLSSGIEVATLEDSSGSVRRDVSLAAGIALAAGQNRDESETQTASHRRLQITTARINQTARLREELRGAASGSRSPVDSSRLKLQIEQLLAVTAPDDRTRLLWEVMTESSNAGQNAASVKQVLLGLLSRHAQPSSIRRWADLANGAMSTSVERKVSEPLTSIARRRQFNTGVSRIAATDELPFPAPEKGVGGVKDGQPVNHDQVKNSGYEVKGGQPISPFQIAPASYESHVGAGVSAPPRILVPETKHTVWQTTRASHAFATPLSSMRADGESQAAESGQENIPARINWDYHPVVMGARGIESMAVKRKVATPRRGVVSPESEFDEQHEKAGQASSHAPRYQLPRTLDRPLLDARDDDACWVNADTWRRGGMTTKCVADDDYVYFGIFSDDSPGLRIYLDCDGDYFTSLQFELKPDGTRRATVDGMKDVSPVWYAVVAPQASAAEPSVDESVGDSRSSRMVAEIAIARSSLPAPICRVCVESIERDALPRWDVMPEASDWHPSRQSTPRRQY
ncbi:DOMON domain-containing protein [Aporhodopirellula aestuarii]|uniref:Uncharacterized protein n=1 Tax=Aporhodopirellula aestuarii TaxID=2950107 RepID=A0ABT0U853_9BACT|nr:hypothetical protein [Aporhodopirellula aestuarii]MCM2372864.1 hypothetical protein [Aporhodopirellula aestuarii]